jgi:TrmH family RNA methyltransferase
MKTIAPISKTKLKFYRKIKQKKYRQQERLFFVEGVHLVEEALSSGWNVPALMITDSFLKKSESGKILSMADQQRREVLRVTEKELASLSDTVTPQGVVAVVGMPSMTIENFLRTLPDRFLVVALENISDPGNIGTILRTCEWFDVDAVLLDRGCVEVYNPKVIRGSMGALFHLPIVDDVDVPDVLRQMKNEGARIIATGVREGTALQSLHKHERMIIVFGSEAHGVSKEVLSLADDIITIPKYGKTESLNVGVACGIVVGSIRLKG